MTDISVYIDVDDFYYEMSDRDREEMYGNLIRDGYGDSFDEDDGKFGFSNSPSNLVEWEFQEIIEKIAFNRLRLSNEEDEILRKIASRF